MGTAATDERAAVSQVAPYAGTFAPFVQQIRIPRLSQEDETDFLVYSAHGRVWYEPDLLIKLSDSRKLSRLRDGQSPIEADAGWRTIRHGVGPVRTSWKGAFRPDLKDADKVVGRRRTSLLRPDEGTGWVPNMWPMLEAG